MAIFWTYYTLDQTPKGGLSAVIVTAGHFTARISCLSAQQQRCNASIVTRTATRSRRTRKHALHHLHVYSPGVAAARHVRALYTVSQKTGPLGYSQIFPTDLDQYQQFLVQIIASKSALYGAKLDCEI